MRWSSILAAISAAFLSAGSAGATIIYDNGGPNQVDLYAADSSYLYTAAADIFSLSAGANTISGVNWWGGCVTGTHLATTCPTGDFTLSIYNRSISTGLPGTLVSSYAVGTANQTATGNLIVGTIPEYSYSASIANLTLTAGTQYWLGIGDSTTSDFIWGWETTSTVHDNAHAQFSTDVNDWLSIFGSDLAFNLTGPGVSAVPEPSSAILLLSGLAGLIGLSRLRFRHSIST